MILTHVMHWIVFIIAVNKIEVHILQTTLLVSDVTISMRVSINIKPKEVQTLEWWCWPFQS